MDFTLDTHQARLLGALVEKEATTPDQYPLSLNALVAACNQKSNRDPVMQLSDSEVQDALGALQSEALVAERRQHGSRVTRYAHRLSGGIGLRFDFSEKALGTLCVLMLRGPQTPGEIRARSERICHFKDLSEVHQALDALRDASGGPYVTQLERRPGFKESRFAHLLCGPVTEDLSAPAVSSAPRASAVREERLDALELEVAALRAELDALKASLGVSD